MARSDEKTRIEGLIGEMTLEEKVGQLTMLSGELVQTGPASAPVTSEAIREGRVGSLLNLWGSERVREVQRHAVEGSRLKIPLFFCLDVLYGLAPFFRSRSVNPAHSIRDCGSVPPESPRKSARSRAST